MVLRPGFDAPPLLPILRPVLPRLAGSFHSIALLVAVPMAGHQEVRPGPDGETLAQALVEVMRPRPVSSAPGPTASPGPEAGLQARASRPSAIPEGRYRITPGRRALLNTIRYAEGTWTNGSRDGYRMLYGGGSVAKLDRHPEIVVRKRFASAAAGAYQFLPATWKDAAARLGLEDFGPDSQDQAALFLMEKRGALRIFDSQGLSREVLALLAAEWASLPASHGGSYYGQPVKGADELISVYNAELSRLSGTANVASRQGLRAG